MKESLFFINLHEERMGMQTTITTNRPKKSCIKTIFSFKEQYMMMLPTVILISLFGIYPILYVLGYSFTEFNGFSPAKFVGLENYLTVIKDSSWWITVWNTVIMGLGIPAIQLPLALLLAILLNIKFTGRDFFRAVIFVPNITSTAIMGIIFFFMFSSYNGIVNAILQEFKLITQPIEWFGDPWLAKLVVIIFCTWSGVGFYMVLFLSALQRIPEDVYESAKIDGAGRSATFFKITLPMMGKMFQIITSLSIINALKLFDSVKALTNGGPGNGTEVMAMYIFRYYFENANSQVGYASAVSIVATILVGIVTAIYMFMTKKFEDA